MASPTLIELRCDDCAFREGTEANKSQATVLKAQLCAESCQPFFCHRREGLCAGWAEEVNRLNAEGFFKREPAWRQKVRAALLEVLSKAEQTPNGEVDFRKEFDALLDVAESAALSSEGKLDGKEGE